MGDWLGKNRKRLMEDLFRIVLFSSLLCSVFSRLLFFWRCVTVTHALFVTLLCNACLSRYTKRVLVHFDGHSSFYPYPPWHQSYSWPYIGHF